MGRKRRSASGREPENAPHRSGPMIRIQGRTEVNANASGSKRVPKRLDINDGKTGKMQKESNGSVSLLERADVEH